MLFTRRTRIVATRAIQPSIENLESRTLLSAAASPAVYAAAIEHPLATIVGPLAVANAPVPVILASPTSGSSPLTVNFSALQSTSPLGLPLHYAWKFGDNSAAVRGSVVQHTYATTGVFNATLIAIDSQGRRSSTREQIAVGVTAPSITIIAPVPGSTYAPGRTIVFSGNANDSLGLAIPNRDFTWTAELHAGKTVTPIIEPIVGVRAGSFVVPAIPAKPNQFLRVTLTVDSPSGLAGTQSVDLVPETANLIIQSTVGGVRVKVNKQFFQTPANIPFAIGSTARVAAPLRVVSNGLPYVFSRWSDGGGRGHTVDIPVGGRTLVAIYRPAPL